MAIVSDTHGEIDARILDIVAGCHVAVHAGDIGGRGVLDALRETGVETVAVRGNNDIPGRWPEAEADVLATIPNEASVALPGGTLVVVHGHTWAKPGIRHERLRRAYPDVRAVVYGHSHRLVRDRQALPWVLNPGAAGRNRTFGGPSCLVLTAAEDRWSVEECRFELLARRRA